MAMNKAGHGARGEKSEVRSQRSEIRRQRTDDRRQKRVELVEKWNRIADLMASTTSTILTLSTV